MKRSPRRTALYIRIRAQALAWALGRAEAAEIDAVNIVGRLDYSRRNGVQNLDLSYDSNGNLAGRTEGGVSYQYLYPNRPPRSRRCSTTATAAAWRTASPTTPTAT